jgi:16S rRNA processing protein RimM
MRVVVGRLGRAHGIRGELTVEVRTDVPEERFAPGQVLLCEGRAGAPPSVTVRAARWQGGRLVVSLDGVTDRTAAEALRGTVLAADVEPIAGLDDEYHDQVLVGLEVRDETGRALGTVADVLHLPGQDLLAVHGPSAREVLVPFVSELVPVVDVGGGFVVVRLPEGLADLASPPAEPRVPRGGGAG